jgi:hypothetical protein
MKNQSTRLHFNGSAPSVLPRFRAAVSLHSHTMHSEESLVPVLRYARRIPIARGLFQLIEERYHATTSKTFDYQRAFWTPPLTAHAALELERRQIEGTLGLTALTSLTDHDNIQAAARLRVMESAQDLPVSLEWTIPRDNSFLHIGVHNLPPSQAQDWVRELNSYTRRPSPPLLGQLLAGLNESVETLLVLNHPLWDEPAIGAPAHLRMLRDFLRDHGRWINALEINGLRPWAENQAVLRLSRSLGYPAVSGGDRHGSTANSTLNLTNALSFGEFVGEVREDLQSTVLMMPQYVGPHGLRYAECVLDVLREYPELAGRHRWMDRAFIREADGSVLPLSTFWPAEGNGSGAWPLRLAPFFLSNPLRSAVRAALAGGRAIRSS